MQYPVVQAPIIRDKNRVADKSTIQRNMAMATSTMITTTVKLRASGQVGQVTLRNSPIVSRKKRWILFSRLLFSLLPATSNSFLSDGENAA
jgi:hypothetical protein